MCTEGKESLIFEFKSYFKMKKWYDETNRKSDVLSKSQKIMMIGRSTLDEVSKKSSKDEYLYFNAKCTGK